MRLKEEDIKEIAKLIDEGYGLSKLCTRFSYPKGALGKIIARYKRHGLNGILHKNSKEFTIEEKITIINRFYSGESKNSLAIELNVNDSLIIQWIKKYEQLGYNGLIDNRGRPGVTKMGRPKKTETQKQTSTTEVMAPVTDTERDELNRLRKENYQLRLELACTKKIQALVQQRQNRQTKKKQ